MDKEGDDIVADHCDVPVYDYTHLRRSVHNSVPNYGNMACSLVLDTSVLADRASTW